MQRPKFQKTRRFDRAETAQRDKNAAPPHKKASRSRITPDHLIYGFHAAEAALSNPERTIRNVYATENAFAKVQMLVAKRGVPFSIAVADELSRLAGEDAVHQGLVLDVEPLRQLTLEEFLDELRGESVRVLMLDQVTDPHNVGAVLRSSAAFGIGALIVQQRHSPSLSASLAKAASGGLEHVPVIETVNLARAIDAFQEHDFECLGFDSDAPEIFSLTRPISKRVCFVFGAEDKGLRRLVRERCNHILALSVPGAIKSLNISNAVAIVLHATAQR